jgi:hypothetical protein
MPRESMSLTQEEFDAIQRRQKGGDAKSPSEKIEGDRQSVMGLGVAPANKKAGAMNSWEQEYAMELESRKRAGEILWWGFESIKLRLADATFYTPDFAAWLWVPGYGLGTEWVAKELRMHFVEVKGHLRDDAAVKFKVAAAQFPFAIFSMLRKKRARDGGGWELMKHLNGSVR